MARASGELIKVLDGDDMLPAGQLAREIAVLTRQRDTAWTTSSAIDLLPDGTTLAFPDDPDEGRLHRGCVVDYWRTHAHHARVHPATLCVRADQLRAIGGWMALPASEDTGLLLTLSSLYDGYFIAKPGLIYRKWSRQMTSQQAHHSKLLQERRYSVIEARLTAMAHLSGKVR